MSFRGAVSVRLSARRGSLPIPGSSVCRPGGRGHVRGASGAGWAPGGKTAGDRMNYTASGMPTASGAIAIRTADGAAVGHGWGEVRVRRDPDTGGSSFVGEVRRM